MGGVAVAVAGLFLEDLLRPFRVEDERRLRGRRRLALGSVEAAAAKEREHQEGAEQPAHAPAVPGRA
jgi:hypothetical protein